MSLHNDIEAIQATLQQMRSSYEEMMTLQLLAASLNRTIETEEVLNLLVNLVGEIVDYDACALYYFEDSRYVTHLSRNVSRVLSEAPTEKISTSLLDWCLRENKVVTVSSIEFSGKTQENSSYILLPIVSHKRSVGILVLECPVASHQITQQQSILLGLLSSQTATAYENAELYLSMKKTNQELAKLKNYLSNILENVTTGIVTLNNAGEITVFNRAAEKLFKLQESIVSGKLFFEVFVEPLRSTIRQLTLSAMLQEEGRHYELDVTLGDGALSLDLSMSLLRDPENQPIGFVLACRDISETKELGALKKLSELKSEFLSSISHELRTPLTSIKAFAETLLIRYDKIPRPTIIESLEIIDSESERLARLLDDLLDFSRIEAGRLQLELQEIDLNQALQGVTSQMRMQSSKHEIVLNIPSTESLVLGDLDRIKQALINILSNAIKYSPEGGKVSLSLYEKDSTYRVEVEDHGMGISSENLAHIFERFYRVEEDRTVKITGTGLGLSITKAIIEAHSGTIGIESQAGIGTKVFFEIPKQQK